MPIFQAKTPFLSENSTVLVFLIERAILLLAPVEKFQNVNKQDDRHLMALYSPALKILQAASEE